MITEKWTIDGFEKLSKQELFDMSVAHIGTTRRKSLSVTGTSCTYGGSGCAAAPFLKPEYREKADGEARGTGWGTLAFGKLVSDHEAQFVRRLQGCHDYAIADNFIHEWKEQMTDLAAMFGLSTEKLDAIKENQDES